MTKKHIILATLGILCISVAINLLILSDLGLSPFDTFVYFLQNFLSISTFGNASLAIHCFFALMLLFLYFKQQKNILLIGVSVLTIFIITRTLNVFSFISQFELNSLFEQIIVFIVGFLLYCLGVLFIAKANFIIPPYDKFVVEMSELFNKDLGIMRITMDVAFLVLSIICSLIFNIHVPFSIATFILAFGTGLMINIYTKILKKFMIKLD